MATRADWRGADVRRELFQRSYTFSLVTGTFPGMVYPMLPAIADAFGLDADQRAWLAWLNGNTQNVVTSMLLLEAAPRSADWRKAVEFWSDHYRDLEWDTDRRHQKSKFGPATAFWAEHYGPLPAGGWPGVGKAGWERTWDYALGQPYMGRLSAWSYLEFARILLGREVVPDMGDWMLEADSSRSHRNSLALISGYDDAWGWDGPLADIPSALGMLPSLSALGDDLLAEARVRNPGHPDVAYLTLESALCTFKSWHKPRRRYPGVYADMMYNRIRRAEVRLGRRLDLLWSIRRDTLPPYLRLEDNPYDPGLAPVKQDLFRETGQVLYLHHLFPDMEETTLEQAIRRGELRERRDPSWTS